jgi:hypothetical protein
MAQDAEAIQHIFTPDAEYYERAFAPPLLGRAGIADYWRTKVQDEQSNIDCELLTLYVSEQTAIAEWECLFDDLADGHRKRMREVAILEFDDNGLIARLREYWASDRLSPLS